MNIVETVSIKKNCSNMCGILPISDLTFNVFKKVAADICLLTANTHLNRNQKQQKQSCSEFRVVLKKRCSEKCSKLAGEHSCRSVISIKFQSKFIEIVLRPGCSPVNLLPASESNGLCVFDSLCMYVLALTIINLMSTIMIATNMETKIKQKKRHKSRINEKLNFHNNDELLSILTALLLIS